MNPQPELEPGHVTDDLSWDEFSGRGDPEQAYRLYRVCPGETTPELIATCGSPEAVGVALCTLGAEGEFLDCAAGVLHVEGEPGKRWLLKPWRAMPKELSAAGRVLGQAGARKGYDAGIGLQREAKRSS